MPPPPVAAASKDGIANPAPLGLCAFGTTTVLLNFHNAGLFEMNSMILAMGIFYGGLAQVIAGVLEAKKNNTFGLTAFTSYGFFWLSLVALVVMPKMGWVAAPSENAMVAYLAVWGVFIDDFEGRDPAQAGRAIVGSDSKAASFVNNPYLRAIHGLVNQIKHLSTELGD